ncbi:MAG TPA: DUF4390 domain-containing protein [Gammaproteobacteria bacterium]|nr:DUF4390 domain-containing protein [Gammaproteobacteria bacterium]
MQGFCRQATKLTLVVVLCAGLAPSALADSFSVQGMSTQRTQGVYYLSADLGLKLNRQAKEALSHGVALTFVVNIKVERRRGWWIWNKTVAALAERYRLSYRPLAERYRLDNLNSGANEEYPTRKAALNAISHIRKLPVIDATLLNTHAHYYVLLRVVLDTHDLPGPLKLLAAILPGWRQASGWRRARLTP